VAESALSNNFIGNKQLLVIIDELMANAEPWHGQVLLVESAE
jgi:hypothetical protein